MLYSDLFSQAKKDAKRKRVGSSSSSDAGDVGPSEKEKELAARLAALKAQLGEDDDVGRGSSPPKKIRREHSDSRGRDSRRDERKKESRKKTRRSDYASSSRSSSSSG